MARRIERDRDVDVVRPLAVADEMDQRLHCGGLCRRLGLDGPEPPYRGLTAQASDRDRDDGAGSAQRRLGGEDGGELNYPAQPVLAAASERNLGPRTGKTDPPGIALESGSDHAATGFGAATAAAARVAESGANAPMAALSEMAFSAAALFVPTTISTGTVPSAATRAVAKTGPSLAPEPPELASRL